MGEEAAKGVVDNRGKIERNVTAGRCTEAVP